MGSKVLVIFKLYPNEIEDTVKIEEGLKNVKEGKLTDVKRVPVGFGLELVKAAFEIPDKTEGVMDKLEVAVKKVQGVKEVEVEGTTLI